MLWTEISNVLHMTEANGLYGYLSAELVKFSLDTGRVCRFLGLYKHLKADKTLDDFVKQFDGLVKLSEDAETCLFVGKEKYSIMSVSGKDPEERVSISFVTLSDEYVKCFLESQNSYFEERTENSVHMLTHSQMDGYDFTNIGNLECPLLRENYEESVVKSFDYISDNLVSQNCRGKFAIISGPPGTGKSYFIKGLIDKISKDSLCIVLPAKLITELDGPSLVPVLMSYKYKKTWNDLLEKYIKVKNDKPLVFIAEDCDNYLVPRDGADSSLISGLLNYTDGIMSDLLNIRFIATTNAPHLEIDPALKRPGRLLAHCFVDMLTPETANEVYQRVSEGKGTEVFEKPISLASVYAKALGQTVYEEVVEKEKKVGF